MTRIIAVALALLLANGARAAAPFSNITFEQAKTRAREQGKILFVDFVTDGCGPCEIMRRAAYKDPAVLAWFAANAVSIEPNAVLVPELQAQLKVSGFPTLIVYDLKGKEADRAFGLHDAPGLLTFLKGAAAGRTEIERLRIESARTKNPMEGLELRLRIANALVSLGRDKEALAEFLWLYDHGPEVNPEFRYMTQGTMMYRLVKLGKRYPPGKDALETRRAAAWKEFELVPASTWTARAVVMIDEKMDDPARTIKEYDALPAGDPRRPVLGALLRDELKRRR